MKIWAKTLIDNKIIANYMYEKKLITKSNFYNCIQEICHEMDIPTPIVTNVNVQHFFTFNITKFSPKDFVESVDFDYFEIEFVA